MGSSALCRSAVFAVILASPSIGVSSPVAAREWSVADFGALGSGAGVDADTDDTAAFQAALDAAGRAGGGVVHVPTGVYRIEGNLEIPGGVTLQGTFRAPPTNRRDGFPTHRGSTLLAFAGRGDPDAPPFILLRESMAGVAGLTIFYPEWDQADVPPVPYPPCIFGGSADNFAVLDCCLINPYEGIRFHGAGRMLVRNVYGYPSWKGLSIVNCFDIGRVENCHFWPFGVQYRHDDPYCLWVNTHGTAFEFGRTDWQYVLNTFCFGYGVGYRFAETDRGSCNGNFLGIAADCCRHSVLVDQTQPGGLLITNGEFVGRWGSNDSVGVEIGPEVSGSIGLVNCAFWGPLARCVWQRGDEAHLKITSCCFEDWDIPGRGLPAVDIDAGKAVLQGNSFMRGKLPVRVGARTRSAILIGNQAPAGFAFENAAGRRTQAVANEEHPVQWTEKARHAYRIDVGVIGDAVYLRGWHRSGRASMWPDEPGTMRWCGAEPELRLPVAPGIESTVVVDCFVPEHAVNPDAGLYLDGERIAAIDRSGPLVMSAVLPAADRDEVRIEVRCRDWVPAEVDPDSRDARTLGIAVRTIEVRSADAASAELFDANGGP